MCSKIFSLRLVLHLKAKTRLLVDLVSRCFAPPGGVASLVCVGYDGMNLSCVCAREMHNWLAQAFKWSLQNALSLHPPTPDFIISCVCVCQSRKEIIIVNGIMGQQFSRQNVMTVHQYISYELQYSVPTQTTQNRNKPIGNIDKKRAVFITFPFSIYLNICRNNNNDNNCITQKTIGICGSVFLSLLCM